MEELVKLGPPGHVSAYQLTLERGTPLWKSVRSGSTSSLPGEEVLSDMYDSAVDILSSRGLKRYEVSNFALPGARCLHNRGYWSGCEFVGIGPGAHSRFRARMPEKVPEATNRACDVIMKKEDKWEELNIFAIFLDKATLLYVLQLRRCHCCAFRP